jgi:hypothetical protein
MYLIVTHFTLEEFISYLCTLRGSERFEGKLLLEKIEDKKEHRR